MSPWSWTVAGTRECWLPGSPLSPSLAAGLCVLQLSLALCRVPLLCLQNCSGGGSI